MKTRLPAFAVLIAVVVLGTSGCTGRRSQELFQAIEAGDTNTVVELCKRDPGLLIADLESERDAQIKALSVAAGLGREAVAEVLLQNGSNVNETDSARRTPLYIAISGGYTNLIELLVHHGADPNRAAVGGRTCRQLAAEVGLSTVLENALKARKDTQP